MTASLFDGSLRVLLLPGWLDSGPGHWQSHWQMRHGFDRVQQSDWVWPRRGDWMVQLEEAVLADSSNGAGADPSADPRPIALAAHSLGCHLVAAWAAHSRHVARVCSALLVAPPDLDRPALPPQLTPWRPALRQPLPFETLVVISDDDPFSSTEASLQLAADWASTVWRLGPRGHVNADSGLDDWPEGLHRLQALSRSRPRA